MTGKHAEPSAGHPVLSRVEPVTLPCEGGGCAATVEVPADGAWRLDFRYRGVTELARRNLVVDGLAQGLVLFVPAGDEDARVSPVTLQLKTGPCRIELTGDWCPVTLVSIELVPAPDRATPALSFRLNNKNASREARLVMRYLEAIHGKAILAGQQTMTPAGPDIRFIEYHTGKQPALRGFDLLGYSRAVMKEGMTPAAIVEAVNNEGSVEAAIRWWKERRGLVTFCWHWHAPLHGRDKAFYTENTAFNLETALIPGTPEHDGLLEDMDIIAEHLKRLRDQRVPILWRPLHEADGGWFWWGAKGAEPYRKLYRWMYERFTAHHQLDHLIWVWNAPAPGCYPGDDVVDLNSIDIYPPPGNYGPLTAGYDQAFALAGGRKPVALAENGPIPDMDELIRSRTPWLWFMTWGGMIMDEKQTSLEHLKRVFDHPYTVTSARLPAWLFEMG